jgi:hypothetical protein
MDAARIVFGFFLIIDQGLQRKFILSNTKIKFVTDNSQRAIV